MKFYFSNERVTDYHSTELAKPSKENPKEEKRSDKNKAKSHALIIVIVNQIKLHTPY